MTATFNTQVTGQGYQHVVWVVMENHKYSEIHGSSSAPYINRLMNTYGLLTNMHATNHPSAPNYVDMTSGGNGSCCTDDGYHNLNVPSIFSQLGNNAGSLLQSMPSACDTSNSGNYAIRHNRSRTTSQIRASLRAPPTTCRCRPRSRDVPRRGVHVH